VRFVERFPHGLRFPPLHQSFSAMDAKRSPITLLMLNIASETGAICLLRWTTTDGYGALIVML
jgi:hypothetical protein